MTVAIRMLDGKGGYLAAGRDFPLIRVEDAINAELFEDVTDLWRWLMILPEEVGSKLDGKPYEVVTVDLDLTGSTAAGMADLIEWDRTNGRPVKPEAAPKAKPERQWTELLEAE